MTTKIFYFSATGNCLEMAQAIDGELYSIPEILKSDSFNFSADKIGFIFPCYALSVPPIVEEFLNKVTIEADYIFGVMTYGEHAGGGLHHFQQIAIKNKIPLYYCEQIKMIDNFLPFFTMEKQFANLHKKHIPEHKQTIANEINNGKVFCRKINFIKATFSRIPRMMYKLFNNGKFDKKFTIEKQCNLCGFCATICPVENIKISSKVEFQHNCITCLACTHRCPQNAIRIKREKSKIRFINDSLKKTSL